MAGSKKLLQNLSAGVLTLTLNRPEVNAFDEDMVAEMRLAMKRAEDKDIRCVLLTASGDVFSAGQDLASFKREGNSPFRSHVLRTYNPMIVQFRRLEKPILAAINGPVAGAALGIVLACDLRIACDSAQFVVGFSRLGLSLDSAVSLLLPTLIGLGRAFEFSTSNEPISADQAQAWGLVNRVVPDSELLEQATSWANQLAHGPVHAFGLTKRAFNRAVLGNLEKVLDYEAHLQEIAGQGIEHREGIEAFLEKRTPMFHRLSKI